MVKNLFLPADFHSNPKLSCFVGKLSGNKEHFSDRLALTKVNSLVENMLGDSAYLGSHEQDSHVCED